MDTFMKFVAQNQFQEKRIEKKGLTIAQWLTYRDFRMNFSSRMDAIEEQLQGPISKNLTKREMINLYSAHYQNEFTPRQFAEKTGMNQNTARRELQEGVKRGLLERIKKGEYRYN